MAAEAKVVQPHSRRRLNTLPRLGFHETRRRPSDVQKVMYQTLVGMDEELKKDPGKYNIGELALGSERSFDTHVYDGQPLKSLDKVDSLRSVKAGDLYIARGVMYITDEKDAVLQTAKMDLNLGQVSPEAQRFIEDKLAGYDMVVPLVFNEAEEGEKYLDRVGDMVAYLIPNPNWRTRQRLRREEAHGTLKGQVTDIDTEQSRTMRILTTVGKFFSHDRQTEVAIGTNHPVYGPGPTDRPTSGVKVGEHDEAILPVKFRRGQGVVLAGDPRLIRFSERNRKSYEGELQLLEQGLDNFDALLVNQDLQKIIGPNKREFDVSTPEKRATVMRYLFAELNRKWNLLTETQQGRLWDNRLAMHERDRSFVFDEGDRMRDVLDSYFLKSDPENPVPRLSEAMTPKQLLYEIFAMASFDYNPPPLHELINLIERYQTEFSKDLPQNLTPDLAQNLTQDIVEGLTPDLAQELIQQVLSTRIDQLQTETGSDAAINSLLDVLPYLKDEKSAHRTEWFASILHFGTQLLAKDPGKWNNSRELMLLMERSASELIESIYKKKKEYVKPNLDAIFALIPYHPYIKDWLDLNIGENEGLEFLLRDLDLISLAREGGNFEIAPQQEASAGEQSESDFLEDDLPLQVAIEA